MPLKKIILYIVALVLSTTLPLTASAKPSSEINTSNQETQSSDDGTRTLLQQDLISLLALGQNLQQEAEAKQKAMEKQLKIQSKTAKTKAQQQELQQLLLTDVIAFKTNQKQQLTDLDLTEPRVIAVRDNMVAGLNAEIAAFQIALDYPNPTKQNKKQFDELMKQSQNYTKQVTSQLDNLTKEAGMAKENPHPKHKRIKK